MLQLSSTQGSAQLQAGTNASLVSEVKAAMAGIMGSAPAVSVPAANASLQTAICEALGLQVRFFQADLLSASLRGPEPVLVCACGCSRDKTVTTRGDFGIGQVPLCACRARGAHHQHFQLPIFAPRQEPRVVALLTMLLAIHAAYFQRQRCKDRFEVRVWGLKSF